MSVDFEKLRRQMVKEQLIKRGIEDQSVLDAFKKVPREKFMLEENKKLNCATIIKTGDKTFKEQFYVKYKYDK